MPNGTYMYNSISEATREIYKNEGIGAFFKGAPARVVRSSPQFAVTLLAYEMLQRVLGLDHAPEKYNPPVNVPVGDGAFVAMKGEGVLRRGRAMQEKLNWSPVIRNAHFNNKIKNYPEAPTAPSSSPLSSSSSSSSSSSEQ